MIKVFYLLFEPGPAWDGIAAARRGFAFILTVHLLPMILLATVAEGLGLYHWGKWQPRFQKMLEFSGLEHGVQAVVVLEVIQGLLFLVMILLAALLVLKLSQTFENDRRTYLQSFTVMAYGFSPLLLMRVLDAAPMMSPWVAWILGVLLTMWTLYQGLARVLRPDPTHAFGLYLATFFIVLLTSALARLLPALYLLGWVDFRHSWLAHKFPALFQ